MPVMNGMECCRALKAETGTSHIPVLMLTACSMDEQRLEGYESGADGYLSKPFNADILRSRCRNLIDNRRRINDTYGNAAAPATRAQRPAPAPGGTRNIDSDFYNRFIEILQADSHNPDLSVEEVASRMGLGQSQFTRKIKALTGYTPVEIIRNYRLQRAHRMLASTERSVSEIAYATGFTSPAYFSKCYRDFFGEAPSDLRSRLSR